MNITLKRTVLIIAALSFTTHQSQATLGKTGLFIPAFFGTFFLLSYLAHKSYHAHMHSLSHEDLIEEAKATIIKISSRYYYTQYIQTGDIDTHAGCAWSYDKNSINAYIYEIESRCEQDSTITLFTEILPILKTVYNTLSTIEAEASSQSADEDSRETFA